MKAAEKEMEKGKKVYEKSFMTKISPRRALLSKQQRINRTRKSKEQTECLWSLYKRTNGVPPDSAEAKQIAEKLGLKAVQIYKWFWDTKKKVDEDAHLASQLERTNSYDAGDLVSRAIKNYRDCIGVDGRDGTGKRLTPQQIKTALKINQGASQKVDEFDLMAAQMGLPIEKIAQELINFPSPHGTR